MTAFITAQGLSKIAMLSVSLGALLNIVLNPVFIYALGLGVKGLRLLPQFRRRRPPFSLWPFFLGKNPSASVFGNSASASEPLSQSWRSVFPPSS